MVRPFRTGAAERRTSDSIGAPSAWTLPDSRGHSAEATDFLDSARMFGGASSRDAARLREHSRSEPAARQ
ncbi:hypothetical protein C7S16_4662 [Burkholderia thailandensis]|uniref:Uncharacterized protein n=1 Tax=Burkholderia thailandensis TaxID=57975 RepID=A0AAW9CS29_BURTH|nr:hypothetical protein [Burkholderia thailandensis]MDW9253409.1 hypothetical protein [Burkholderia thailandensis]